MKLINVKKKGKLNKIFYNVRDFARDSAINRILESFGMNSSAIIYNLITSNPIQVAVEILTAKYGLSKTIISLIIIFVL